MPNFLAALAAVFLLLICSVPLDGLINMLVDAGWVIT